MVKIPDISYLFIDAKIISYNRGELIIRSDDDPQGVYLIEAGFVKALSKTNGSEYIHLIFSRGDVFPLAWSIDGSRREINFKALTPVIVKRVSRDQFLNTLLSNPTRYKLFLDYVMYMMLTYTDRVENLRYKYASDRVIYRLLFLSSRFGNKKGKQISLKIPITHNDLASSLSLSVKTVSRELNRLRRKGLIVESRDEMVILDYEKLNKQLSMTINNHIIEILNAT